MVNVDFNPQVFNISLALYITFNAVGIFLVVFYLIFLKIARKAFSHKSSSPIQEVAEAITHFYLK